uniref:MSP domain-containing protein n=1 Tax=Kalanchoe fedtschenkoi TaxID=63787 RepID=A0A7N0UHW1_KALFE
MWCNHVQVKTTNPKKYSVRPNAGIVLPRSTSDIIVTMQAQKEAPVELQSKDKFLLQSVKAPDGSTAKDISPEMFSKEAGNIVEECKLRVVYVVPQRTPPIPEGSDEGSSPKGSASDNGNSNGFAVTRAFNDSHEKSYEEKKLAEEVEKALQENRRLREELEQLRVSASKKSGGISFKVMILVAILSILLGYLLNR